MCFVTTYSLMKKHTNVYSDKLFQFSSVTQSCPTLCDPKDCSTSGLPVHHQLLEFTQTHVHWVGDAIQSSHPLLPPSPPALNLSQHKGLLKWVSSRIRWPKYWSFSFNISPSKESSGLISFRMDWLWTLDLSKTIFHFWGQIDIRNETRFMSKKKYRWQHQWSVIISTTNCNID